MTPRNTNTGGVLEAMILPALKRGFKLTHYQGDGKGRPLAGGRTGGNHRLG